VDIDMLADQFTIRRPVLKASNSAANLEDTSAFSALDEAYDHLKRQLDEASAYMITLLADDGENDEEGENLPGGPADNEQGDLFKGWA
jgi:hypothetical protein